MFSLQSQDGQISDGMPYNQSQQDGKKEPERDPQQEDQQDPTGGKDLKDYDPDVDYEGSELKVEQSAPKQREVDPDAKYTNMEITQDGTTLPEDDALGAVYGDPAGT